MLIPYGNRALANNRYVRYVPRAAGRAAVGISSAAAAKYGYNLYRRYSGGRPTVKQLKKAKRNLRVGKRKIYKNVKTLKKQVSELKKIAQSDQGNHIHRFRASADNGAAVASSQFAATGNVFQFNTLTRLEEVLAELRYYNPSVPGTLVQADGATGTFHKEFYFKRAYHKFTVRNNYQVPARVSVYIFCVKESTSITPQTAYTNGLADVGNPTSTSCLVYPTDSPELMELYRIDKSVSRVLMPGQEFSILKSSRPFQYDPALGDSHTSEYQRVNQSGSFGIRTEGVLGHDTVADQQGTLECKVDTTLNSTYEVIYAAGADIKFITVNDTSDSVFTNSGVISNMPISDNQAFSTA